MLHAVFAVIAEVLCGLTEHFILWAITLDRHKSFEHYDHNLAMILGLVFWVAVAGGIALLFIR